LNSKAGVWAARALIQTKRCAGKRHLILSDSMSGVGAATKGRASPGSTLRRGRELLALSIAAEASFHLHGLSDLTPAERRTANASDLHIDNAGIPLNMGAALGTTCGEENHG
jgi:hypothetical protein